MMPGWFSWPKPAWARLALTLAGIMLLWLLAASLATNAANVLHLRIALDPAERGWAPAGDRLYTLATALGAEKAKDLWQASATAAGMEEFIRAQLLTGDVASLCVALEQREALWPRACEPCFVAYVRLRRDQDVLRLFNYLAVEAPLSPELTPERRRALAWIYFDAGKAFYNRKALSSAMEQFEVAEALFDLVPPAPEALYSLIGISWLSEGYPETAETYLRRAPNDLNAVLALANLYIQREDWDSAIRTSSWGVTRWPTVPHFYRKRAVVYAATGQDHLASQDNAEAERLQRESGSDAP
jgi:tetratricopeptide (TPR) repeat protein